VSGSLHRHWARGKDIQKKKKFRKRGKARALGEGVTKKIGVEGAAPGIGRLRESVSKTKKGLEDSKKDAVPPRQRDPACNVHANWKRGARSAKKMNKRNFQQSLPRFGRLLGSIQSSRKKFEKEERFRQ